MSNRERQWVRHWPGVAVYLAIALGTLAILALLLKKTSATHLNRGSALVMLMYLTAGGFMLIASRLLVRRDDDRA